MWSKLTINICQVIYFFTAFLRINIPPKIPEIKRTVSTIIISFALPSNCADKYVNAIIIINITIKYIAVSDKIIILISFENPNIISFFNKVLIN